MSPALTRAVATCAWLAAILPLIALVGFAGAYDFDVGRLSDLPSIVGTDRGFAIRIAGLLDMTAYLVPSLSCSIDASKRQGRAPWPGDVLRSGVCRARQSRRIDIRDRRATPHRRRVRGRPGHVRGHDHVRDRHYLVHPRVDLPRRVVAGRQSTPPPTARRAGDARDGGGCRGAAHGGPQRADGAVRRRSARAGRSPRRRTARSLRAVVRLARRRALQSGQPRGWMPVREARDVSLVGGDPR